MKNGFTNYLMVMIICLSSAGALWAQEVEVTGTVTSQDDGGPLPGVSVLVQGTTTGTVTDLDGKYSQGDFVVRNAGEVHQPTATQDTDCICLVSLQRPVRARSWWYRLLEPLVQYRLSRIAN